MANEKETVRVRILIGQKVGAAQQIIERVQATEFTSDDLEDAAKALAEAARLARVLEAQAETAEDAHLEAQYEEQWEEGEL